MDIDRPPTKLWEGNVLSRVFLSVHREWSPVTTTWTFSNLFTWGLSGPHRTGIPPQPYPQTCSNLSLGPHHTGTPHPGTSIRVEGLLHVKNRFVAVAVAPCNNYVAQPVGYIYPILMLLYISVFDQYRCRFRLRSMWTHLLTSFPMWNH